MLLELSGQLAMAIGAGIGVVGIIPALLLIHLPSFKPMKQEKGDRVLRRPGVRGGLTMGAIAGLWKGRLDSYVPVVLTLVSQSAATIGFLVAIGNAALLTGTGVAGHVRRVGVRGTLLVGVSAATLGMAARGPLAGIVIVLPAGAAFVVAAALMLIPAAFSFRPGARRRFPGPEEPSTG